MNLIYSFKHIHIPVFSTHMIVVCTSISDDFMAVRTRVGLGGHVFGLDVVLDIGGLGLVSTGKTLPPAPAKIGHQRLYTLQLCKSTAHSTFSILTCALNSLLHD